MQFYGDKFENLGESNNFLENKRCVKLTQHEIENMTRPINILFKVAKRVDIFF